jgi:hypothetical protein
MSFPRAALADDIIRAAEARESEPDFPTTRIARIRAIAAKLGATQVEPGDIRHAALLLERQATIDLEVPTASRVPGVHLVKQAVKKLMMWYLRFLAAQMTAFGHATAKFGVTVASRMDEHASRIDQLEAEIAQLQARLDRLEAADRPEA